MTDLFWFSDAQWSRIEPLLPSNTRGLKRVDDRRVLSGIVHVIRSGGRWCDAPAYYGPKKTLYNRYIRWAERGVWHGIFSSLAGADGAPDRLMIDSTIVKVHRSSGGGKGGSGSWYRPLQRRKDNRSPPRDRRSGPALRDGDRSRKCQ